MELVSEEAQWLNTVMSYGTLQWYRGRPYEVITVIHRLDLISCVCGLAYKNFSANSFPLLALVMGFSFALYGLARKFIRYDAITSITLEKFWALPVAIFILIQVLQHHLTFLFSLYSNRTRDSYPVSVTRGSAKSYVSYCDRPCSVYRALPAIYHCHTYY